MKKLFVGMLVALSMVSNANAESDFSIDKNILKQNVILTLIRNAAGDRNASLGIENQPIIGGVMNQVSRTGQVNSCWMKPVYSDSRTGSVEVRYVTICK
jgi:hypothetical protein